MEENLNQNIVPPTEPVLETSTPPVNQPPFGSWWKVGVLVVGVLLAGSISYAGYQYSQRQTLPPIAYPTNIPTPSFTPTLTPTPTVSLRPISTPTPTKTLSNKRFTLKCRWCSSGFSFELPSTTTILPEPTTISEDSNGAPYWGILSPFGRIIIMYRGSAVGNLYIWFDEQSTSQPYNRETWKNPPNIQFFSVNNIKKYMIGNQQVVEFSGCWNEAEDICKHPKLFLFQSGGKLWQIHEDEPATYRKIVETIRFD